MGILNKFSVSEVISAINTQNKELICSVPGVGQKMAERLILELKSNLKNEFKIDKNCFKNEILKKNTETDKIINDLELTLHSLNYKNKDIQNFLPIIIKETEFITKKGENISFEDLLKFAMDYLDKDGSNIVR